MKLTLLILTLVVSCMATAHVDYDEETELHSFIESLLQSAKQQQTGIHIYLLEPIITIHD